jgi:hypothetical protein
VDTRLIVEVRRPNNPQKGHDLPRRFSEGTNAFEKPHSDRAGAPDIRAWLTKRARLAGASVVNRRAEKKFPLSAIKSVQDFGQQRQQDDRSDRDQRDASCFG